jgi:hypothetical protein
MRRAAFAWLRQRPAPTATEAGSLRRPDRDLLTGRHAALGLVDNDVAVSHQVDCRKG